MKKFLVMAVMAIMALGASAQWYAGGSIGYTHTKVDAAKGDQFTIAPEVGYNLTDTWGVGAAVKYQWVKDAYNTFYINPYARYTFYKADIVSLFCDGGFDLGYSKPKGGESTTVWGIGLQPGISLNFNEHFSLVAHFGYIGYRDLKEAGKVYGLDLSNNLSFGFYYNF